MILFVQNSRKGKIVVTADQWFPRTVYVSRGGELTAKRHEKNWGDVRNFLCLVWGGGYMTLLKLIEIIHTMKNCE